MELTFTAGTWWALADRIGNRNMTFSTGWQERTADLVAAGIVEEVEGRPLHEDVTIEFGDSYDAYLTVLQAMQA